MVTHIKTGIRTVGLRFDAHAVLFLCEMHGVEISDLDQIKADEYLPSFVWCAHRSYKAYKNSRCRISYARMRRIISRLRVDEYQKMNEAMRKASPPQDETEVDVDDKKKLHGKISSSQDGGPEYTRTTS